MIIVTVHFLPDTKVTLRQLTYKMLFSVYHVTVISKRPGPCLRSTEKTMWGITIPVILPYIHVHEKTNIGSPENDDTGHTICSIRAQV